MRRQLCHLGDDYWLETQNKETSSVKARPPPTLETLVNLSVECEILPKKNEMARSTTSFLLCALFLLGTLAIIQVIDLSRKFLTFASFSDLNLLVLVFIFPLYVIYAQAHTFCELDPQTVKTLLELGD